MTRHAAGLPILAITYTDSELAANVMRRLANALMRAGARCAGFLQRDVMPSRGRSRCDMVLDVLGTQDELKLSEDRGALARGCRLDVDALATAVTIARDAMLSRPDVLVVNKFGKSEAEGGGCRPLIADAMQLDIPVVIAVPWRNIESWRIFAGDFAREIAADDVAEGTELRALASLELRLLSARSHIAGADLPDRVQRSQA